MATKGLTNDMGTMSLDSQQRYNRNSPFSNNNKKFTPRTGGKNRQFSVHWKSEEVEKGMGSGKLIQGMLRVNQKNFEEAYVGIEGEDETDIYIEGMRDRNRAFHTDIVVVKLKDSKEWKKLEDGSISKTGEVVFVSDQKHSRRAVGKLKPLQDGSRNFALFSPADSRIPRMMIPGDQCPDGFFERPRDFWKFIYIAKVVSWSETSKMPRGELVKNLGLSGEIGPETEGILSQFDVDDSEFSEECIECLPDVDPNSGWKIPDAEFRTRRDFRNDVVFTIDPKTARDLDDALHVKYLGDGYFEVGVHIADVSYFVVPDTELDTVAADRCTSTYLIHKVIPMLPRLLCEELCSLNPGVDRLCFSVCWKMNLEGKIEAEWFGRSIIRSRVKLAYEHAQGFLDEPSKEWDTEELPEIFEGATPREISDAVNTLGAMAKVLRSKRFEGGALRLDQPKLSFSLDKDTGLPDGCTQYKLKDSNRLIEEFMLLANMAVAHRIHSLFPSISILRRHPPPDKKQMIKTLGIVKALGFNFNAASSGSLNDSLNQYKGESSRAKAIHLVLSNLFMKPMKLAVYFCSGEFDSEVYFRHYALSVPFYTHFTSPIRRYPDIMVHRLLGASLGYCEPPTKTLKKLSMQCVKCNDRKYNAKMASEASGEMFFAIFVKACGPLEVKGIVCLVQDLSIDVLIPDYGIIKRIYCNRMRLDSYDPIEGDVPKLKLTWSEKEGGGERVISMLDEVDVILAVDKEPLKFWARLKSPKDYSKK